MFIPALIVLASQDLVLQWNLEEPSQTASEIVAEVENVAFPRTGQIERRDLPAFGAKAFVDQSTVMGPRVDSLGLSHDSIFGLDFSTDAEISGDLHWRAFLAVDGIAQYPLSDAYPIFTDSSGNSHLTIAAQWPLDAEGISVEIVAVSAIDSQGPVQVSNSIHLFTLPATSATFGEFDSTLNRHVLASR